MSVTSTRTFGYTGRDARGKLVKGKLEAPNEGAVATRLRSMGLSPVSVEAAGATGLQREISLPGFKKNVGLKDHPFRAD
jgi:type IV pilus assembly protein PilC